MIRIECKYLRTYCGQCLYSIPVGSLFYWVPPACTGKRYHPKAPRGEHVTLCIHCAHGISHGAATSAAWHTRCVAVIQEGGIE